MGADRAQGSQGGIGIYLDYPCSMGKPGASEEDK
jgi:hypothetical protein